MIKFLYNLLFGDKNNNIVNQTNEAHQLSNSNQSEKINLNFDSGSDSDSESSLSLNDSFNDSFNDLNKSNVDVDVYKSKIISFIKPNIELITFTINDFITLKIITNKRTIICSNNNLLIYCTFFGIDIIEDQKNNIYSCHYKHNNNYKYNNSKILQFLIGKEILNIESSKTSILLILNDKSLEIKIYNDNVNYYYPNHKNNNHNHKILCNNII
jgi:hypothetical protein